MREETIKKIKPVLQQYNIKKAALFGSFARNEATSESDVDILVDMPEGSTLLDLAGLQQDLCDKLDRKVDVVTYRSINPKLKDYITNDQVKVI